MKGVIPTEQIDQGARERITSDVVYEITSRWNSIRIFPYKCVIYNQLKEGLTIDGNSSYVEETIYFQDVTGIQFKSFSSSYGVLHYGHWLFETPCKNTSPERNYNINGCFYFDEDTEPIARKAYEYVIEILDELKADGITRKNGEKS